MKTIASTPNCRFSRGLTTVDNVWVSSPSPLLLFMVQPYEATLWTQCRLVMIVIVRLRSSYHVYTTIISYPVHVQFN